jgi:hypothetical protein
MDAQVKYDSTFIKKHDLPNYASIDFQHLGSGLHFYNKAQGIDRGPVYPFESAQALGFNLTYKFFTIGYMQTIKNKVNRSAFHLGTSIMLGAWEFSADYYKYKNLAILEPQPDHQLPVDIKYSSISAEAIYNFNASRYSSRAVLYGDKIQSRSAGAFMLSAFPVYRYLSGNAVNSKVVVPDDAEFRTYFGKVAGMTDAKFYNLDIRPGYSYTWAIKKGLYFLSAGAMLGTGFGYHSMNTEIAKVSGWHWQASGRFLAAAGYNGPRIFAIGQYRYTGSVSVINPALISVEEGILRVRLGYRFGHIEKTIPVESPY